jgi:mRNA-degrading endonuclease YafQ of YafQ-DinJ toxin-antitoxin module
MRSAARKTPEITVPSQSYEVIVTQRYAKRLLHFLTKHPDLKAQYYKTIAMLETQPFHPSLRLHALSDKHQGLHSVSINLSYRITLEFLIVDRQITPVNIGDHDVVY